MPISGYAIVFYQEGNRDTVFEVETQGGGIIEERIFPEAVRQVIDNRADVAALFNHDPSALLGRFPGTMRLQADRIGLRYEIDERDATDLYQRVEKMQQRGDLRGHSFGFQVPKGGQTFRRDGNRIIRELRQLVIRDVGPVTYPAYAGTVRSLSAGERRFVDSHCAAGRVPAETFESRCLADVASVTLRLAYLESMANARNR